MKKIKSISLSFLRGEEDFGFLKLILSETSDLPKDDMNEDDRPVIESISAKASSPLTQCPPQVLKSPPSTAIAAEADTARDNAWRGANNYLKAMTAHPIDQVHQTARYSKVNTFAH